MFPCSCAAIDQIVIFSVDRLMPPSWWRPNLRGSSISKHAGKDFDRLSLPLMRLRESSPRDPIGRILDRNGR